MSEKRHQGSSGYRLRDAIRLFRMTLLLIALVVAATLNHWSHRGDPRFFAFLNSAPGLVCARVFGWWNSPLEQPLKDKPERNFSPRELAVKDAIQHAVDLREENQDPERYRVSYRDVAFRLEYTEEPLHLYPPYAIISELPATELDRTMTAVNDVYDGFHHSFGPLLTQTPDGELIHLLYFASEEPYLEYQGHAADAMENTSGFYSPARNRLVLYRDPKLDESQSLLTIRHEAAHQLFYTYGVHSRHRIENEWLIEGLASYCETPRVGSIDGNQVLMLQHARQKNRLIPIQELVNHRNERGLLAYKPAELAYAQSWSLVHFLMQDTHRDKFFDYVRHVRSPDAYRDVRDTERIDLLCAHLDLPRDELQWKWEHYLEILAGPGGPDLNH